MEQRAARIRDVVLGTACLALAVALVVLSRGLKAIPGQQYGADTLPHVIAGLAAIIGLWMLATGITGRVDAVRSDEAVALHLEGAEAEVAPEVAASGPHWIWRASSWLRLAAALGLVVAYMILAEPAGFMPAAFVMVLGLLLLLGVRPLTALLIAVPAVALTRWGFADLLLVPLPRSPFLGGW